jgi:hypothetical protein
VRCLRQRGQSREWAKGLRGQSSRDDAGLYRLGGEVEVDPDGPQEQKRGCEQHRACNREPGIVAMLAKKTPHCSPIGA